MDAVELTPGALAAFLLELAKWIVRAYIKKDPDWSLEVKWNVAIVAILAYLITPLFAYLAIGTYSFPTSLAEFTRQLVILVMQVLVGMTVHFVALSPASAAAKNNYHRNGSYMNKDVE